MICRRTICAVSMPLLALLAACGGGGGGGATSGGSITPPTPTVTPSSVSVSGTVVQLTEPLAHATQSCTSLSAAPCPANPPSASAMPQAGSPIAGATVYIVSPSAVVSSAIPSGAVSGTTDSNGAFSVTYPSSLVSSGQVGIEVVNGSQIVASPRPTYGYGDQTFTLGSLPTFGVVTPTPDRNLGTTDKGFIVAHLLVNASAINAGTIYLDQPSADERSGLASMDYWRSTVGAPPLVMDMALQMALRRDAPSQFTGANCTLSNAASVDFAELGGVGSLPTIQGDIDAPSWSLAFYSIATNENTHAVSAAVGATATWGGAEGGLVIPHGCGSSPATTMFDYEVAENG